jgi:hypothetical protein
VYQKPVDIKEASLTAQLPPASDPRLQSALYNRARTLTVVASEARQHEQSSTVVVATHESIAPSSSLIVSSNRNSRLSLTS